MRKEKCTVCQERSSLYTEISTYAGVYGDTWTRLTRERIDNLKCDCLLNPEELEIVKEQRAIEVFSKNKDRFARRWGVFPENEDEFRKLNIPKFINTPFILDLFRRLEDKEFLIYSTGEYEKKCYLLIFERDTIDYINIDKSLFKKGLCFETYISLLEHLEGKYYLGHYFKNELKKITSFSDSEHRYLGLNGK